MTKRRRQALLQTTGYAVFPVLMVVEEEDNGRTRFQPIPLERTILLWWLSLLLTTWLHRIKGTAQKILGNSNGWVGVLIERVTLEFKMGTILTRQLTLGVLIG